MPSLIFSTRYSPSDVRIEGTLGLPWKLLLNDELFTTGQGDQVVRLGILTGGQVTLTLDVVSFPLVRETVSGLITPPDLPLPPTIPPPPPVTPEPEKVAPGAGYWKNNRASPNDSSAFAYGVRYASEAACMKAYADTGKWTPPGTCSYVPSAAELQAAELAASLPGRISALEKWAQDAFAQLKESVQGVQEIRSELAGIWDKLEAWLVERLVSLMLRALNLEAKKHRGKT